MTLHSRPLCLALRSFRRAGQPGRLTRLLSCSDEKLREYRWLGIMPTFVVPDIEYDEEQDDHYTAYNKPFSIATWLKVGLSLELYPHVRSPSKCQHAPCRLFRQGGVLDPGHAEGRMPPCSILLLCGLVYTCPPSLAQHSQ